MATAVMLGEGATALAGGKGAGTAAIGQAENAALKNAAKEGAALRPYGGPGGGHHVPAKSAFNGAPGYDPNKALAIPNAELARHGVYHPRVTAAQAQGYRSLALNGEKLTWEAMERIETGALIKGGMNSDMATTTVQNAIEALRQSGVESPMRIPWGK